MARPTVMANSLLPAAKPRSIGPSRKDCGAEVSAKTGVPLLRPIAVGLDRVEAEYAKVEDGMSGDLG
jgi:hypothetical protein